MNLYFDRELLRANEAIAILEKQKQKVQLKLYEFNKLIEELDTIVGLA